MHNASAAQDSHIVCHGKSLVQLVRDKYCGMTCDDICAKPAQQIIHFQWRQNSGGLIENEQRRVTSERLRDLDALLRTNG
jgi:hypothetical protein